MEIYLLKASAILALFLLFYRVFLKDETFFHLNRFFLLTGLLAAVLLPLVTIRQEVLLPVSFVAAGAGSGTPIVQRESPITLESLLRGLYLAGIGYFLFRMLLETRRLLRMMRRGERIRKEGFILVPGRFGRGPFSFFRYIFYDPESHQGEELSQILEHEKAHGRQLHSLDVLLGRIVAILLWANPLAWWYQKNMHQNLEYLADAQAVRKLPSVRQYQYTLLKVSGNPITPGLVNAFYSSLIKKRIVMLQQNQSKTIHLFKYLLILPVLALFLMAFNRETVYVPQGASPQELFAEEGKTIEVIIDKGTTDAELLEMKESFKKDKVDFSYTVVRNESGEIIDIELDIKGTSENGHPFSGSYAVSDKPIKPILIRVSSTGGIYIGEVDAHKSLHHGNEFHFDTDSGNTTVWVQKSGGSEGEEVIEIRKEDGKEVIIMNGEEITREELHEAGGSKKVMIKMLGEGDHTGSEGEIREIRIIGADSDEEIIEINTSGDKTTKYKTVIIDKEKSGDHENIHVISTDGRDPLYVIDGKKANKKKMDNLSPDQIETINVLKGDAAVKKYGDKAKDGVIEITTKKQ